MESNVHFSIFDFEFSQIPPGMFDRPGLPRHFFFEPFRLTASVAQ
jgi:hypothetical protein